MSRRRVIAALAGAAAIAGVLVLAIGGGADGPPEPPPIEEKTVTAPALADPVPYDGRSPRLATGSDVRVLVSLPRPALGELENLDAMDGAARRAYVESLKDESRALRSALDARGVRLRDVVTYERAWHGFSATVRNRDLEEITAAGARTRPIRRFFPAVSEPAPVQQPVAPAEPPSGAPTVALLAGGVAGGQGRDLVDGDRDPSPGADPRDPNRTESSGTVLSGLLNAAGVRVRALRVSALRATAGMPLAEEHARTDELLAGLERAVDPNLDGDPSDHVKVALIGVSAPYAGFADSPEAEAVHGATRLGTLIVAPAGHEGAGRGGTGTIGSPAAAPDALAVGALSDPAAVARVRLQVGEDGALDIADAALLGGAPPATQLTTGDGAGEVAVVQADANPGARISAAAAAGAAAVVLCEPRADRPLPALPAGRVGIPAIGVTGEAAQAMLDAGSGQPIVVGAAVAPTIFGAVRLSPFSSRGPAYDGTRKPDIARPASRLTPSGVAGGTGVAAAAAAADAAHEQGTLDEIRRRLVAAAQAVGEAAGASEAGRSRAAVGAGPLRLEERDGRTTGVVFRVGAFDRGDVAAGVGTLVVPAGRLTLVLQTKDGETARRLTPAGGERGLLPGEYAYHLSAETLDRLEPGTYRFVARARAPGQAKPTVAESEPFRVR